MRLSTFSFDRAPVAASGKVAVLAMVFAGLVLGVIELYLRTSDGHPSLPLSKSRHASILQQGLTDPDPRTTLLLGASRIRSGFSSRTFKNRTNQAPLYYLATSGESPLALIIYLADKTEFSGKLIVSLSTDWLAGDSLKQQQYIVDYFENEWNWNQKLNHILGDLVATKFVFRQENYSVVSVLKSAVRERNLPPVPHWRRHTINGESFLDFSLVRDRIPVPALRNYFQVENDPVWEENLGRLNRAVSLIRDRGGQVALVRFPISGNVWANNQIRWPREKYWDRIAATVGPNTVHFQDFEALRQFDQPDASHIDLRDKDKFTGALLDALARGGMTWTD